MARDLTQLMRRLFLPADAVQEACWRPSIDIYRTPEGCLVKLRPIDDFSPRSLRIVGQAFQPAEFGRQECLPHDAEKRRGVKNHGTNQQ